MTYFKPTWQKIVLSFILLFLLISFFIPVIIIPPPAPWDNRLQAFQPPITIAMAFLPYVGMFITDVSPYPDYPLLPGIVNLLKNFFPTVYAAITGIYSIFSLPLLIVSPLFYLFIIIAYVLSCIIIKNIPRKEHKN